MRIAIALTLLACLTTAVTPKTYYPGQYAQIDPALGKFLSNQNRPDMKPWTGNYSHDSCCGPADAYEADDWELVKDEDGGYKFYAVITEGEVRDPKITYCDDNGNPIGCKPFVQAGTKVLVPPEKIIIHPDPPNDTGHGWVWIARGLSAFCYVYPTGG